MTDEFFSPSELHKLAPLSAEQASQIAQWRQEVAHILDGQSNKRLMIVGPCSIHNPEAALNYARKLHLLAEEVSDTLFIVMRSYLEKPRTVLGWKGLLYDPDLNGSDDIRKGFHIARKFLHNLVALGLPAAIEFLDPCSPAYFGDLITWASVGSRTSESQIHRQMASGLPMTTGFKNGTDGGVDCAIHAVEVAQQPHIYPEIKSNGRLGIRQSEGNPYCHVVLRGGATGPNYHRSSVRAVHQALNERELNTSLLIDCSHDNCGKDHRQQAAVFHDVLSQILEGNHLIRGWILESYLEEGSQNGSHSSSGTTSITDPCVGWKQTEQLIRNAHEALEAHALATSC